ncbi:MULTISPECIES: hypothetical protein [unclassified Curtobacterium]|uniref:hypothetical protein n=1 Tax=unclassified Curtobacterium TaxID=257496 RepID=UPI00105284A2|nr:MULTISPECIES: hypothetical protein [unclassified Curtobacterium]
MDSMRRWPLWAVMIVLAVAFGGFWYLSTFVTMPADVPVWIRGTASAVTGAAFGVIFGLWIGRQRRSVGPAARDRALGRAVRRGELPADADPAQWRQALEHYQQQYRRQRWFGPVVFVLAMVLEVSLAVTGRPVFWFAAAMFLVFLIVTLLQTPRVLRNTAAMLVELDRRNATDTH